MRQFILLMLVMIPYIIHAQINATTEDGKKVILKDDGTWEYVDPIDELASPNTGGEERVYQEIIEITPVDCDFAMNETDEFTGDRKVIVKQEYIGSYLSYKLYASIGRVQTEYGLYMNFTGDLGCVAYDSYTIFKFEDGSTLEFKNIADTDCGDMPTFIAQVMEEDIKKLKKVPVSKIRLRLSQKYADIEVFDNEFFKNAITCLW